MASRHPAIHAVLDGDGEVRLYERGVLCGGGSKRPRLASGRVEDVTCGLCLAGIARELDRPAPAPPPDSTLRPPAARILLAGLQRIIESEGIDEAARRIARDTIAEARALPIKRYPPRPPWLPWRHNPDIYAAPTERGVRLVAQSRRATLWLAKATHGVVERDKFHMNIVVVRDEAGRLMDRISAAGLSIERGAAR